jgi:hypothetical protein
VRGERCRRTGQNEGTIGSWPVQDRWLGGLGVESCQQAVEDLLAAWTFGIVAAIMALIFIWQPIPATGKPVGIIVFLALAFLGTAVLRRQTAEEFPDA